METDRLAALGRFAALAALVLVAGCGRQGQGQGQASAEKTYPLTGEVVSADAAKKTITVRHDAVQGLMPAMTMEFSVSSADVAAVHAGERIRADLILDKAGGARLERIWPNEHAANAEIEEGAVALSEDTHIRGNGVYREVGEDMPGFALYDQEGRVVQSGRFRGKQIMLNFIYSRCPVATMCPAATANMMTTQALARKAGVKNLELVSITLDPENDTPAVLKEYARVRGIDTSNFSFLTGPEGTIRDLLAQFGVIAEFKDGILKHTLTTLLIDERGKIVWRADGSAWEPADFVAKMRKG